MTKRLLAPILVAVLAMGVLAGCGNKQATGGDSVFKAGMVTDVGGLEDASFNESAWRGLNNLQAELGEDKVAIKAIESQKPEDYINNLTTFAETDPHDIIWSIGFMMHDATAEMAKQFPDKHFGIIDSHVEAPNVASVLFKEHEGSFLVGMLAAKTTKTGKVGFVGGAPGDVIGRFEAGFRAGVAYADPNVETLVVYAGVFDDPATGKENANTLISQGADVIFHAAGYTGNGVIAAADEKGIKAIGVDSDQSHLAPNTVISSMIKQVDVAVHTISKAAAEGNFKGGLTVLGLKENGVGWSDTTVFPDDATKQAMEQAKQDIIDGKIEVPDTPDAATEWIKNL